jgi:hypothetical protein
MGNMVNEFSLNESIREMVPDEQRAFVPVDDDLWALSQDEFFGWVLRYN